jgi:SAM-dependent methyltransferase
MGALLENTGFPKSNRYNPQWILESPTASHPLWLTEWLAGHMQLQPGMRVLDLGCGKAKSSIFLAREFDVEVWAVDLWTSADENLLRIEDAGVSDLVFPIHADARQLPFAGEFFDAIVCIDSFQFFGTDDLYLNYLAHFLREEGVFAFVSPALRQEMDNEVPAHLQPVWMGDYWSLHTLEWWRGHIAKTGLFDVLFGGEISDGWRLWEQWAEAAKAEKWYRRAIKDDEGRYLGYAGVVAARIPGRPLARHAWPCTLTCAEANYVPHPTERPSVRGERPPREG